MSKLKKSLQFSIGYLPMLNKSLSYNPAFVIMSNHIHLLVRSESVQLSNTITNRASFVGRCSTLVLEGFQP
ncbi:hypothetical protein [Candidatus Symbiothrix dinenymphae]|uniref:hypothetical protein n=1 Tax=Candidatus Symbiothrix dinenymphae TaxID=467085 RepID=UPI000A87DCFD|nr:hypothetical protein [Candidatus Symbiothrix dinenymphae]